MSLELPKVPTADDSMPEAAQLRELREWAEDFRNTILDIINLFDVEMQRRGQPAELPIATAADVVAGVKYRPVQPGRMIYVEDDAGGTVTAFADGTSWRRHTDRAVVS